jgi:hypothetical protein
MTQSLTVLESLFLVDVNCLKSTTDTCLFSGASVAIAKLIAGLSRHLIDSATVVFR